MAARKRVEDEVRALAALRETALDAGGHARVAAALGVRSSAVVAAAAAVVARAAADAHERALIEAFERFMLEPTETDKGCLAKAAIARALFTLEADCDALWLRAVRHVQLEPVWGGKQDTAVELRGVAAAALVQADYPEVMAELARLLTDREPMARVGAAQALGTTRHVDAAVPLLRFKVLTGDADARVIAACLTSLLATAPAASLPFVAELLEASDAALRESAAIALGESRLAAALPCLLAAVERSTLAEERRALYLGIALLRDERGQVYLLERVAEETEPLAKLALEALAVFKHDEALCARVRQVANARGGKVARLANELLGE